MYIEREGKEQRLQEQIPKKRGHPREEIKSKGKKKSQNTTTHGNDPKK